MKKLFTILMLSSILTAAYSQEKTTTAKSNLESFSEISGSFSKKEFTNIGKTKSIVVQTLVVTDMITKKALKGIKLSGFAYASYGSSEKSAFLDEDEIENFLKAISFIGANVFNSAIPANDVEYNFYGRSGFSAGAFNDSKGKWNSYVKLEKYDSKSFFSMTPEDFAQLADLITKAKANF